MDRQTEHCQSQPCWDERAFFHTPPPFFFLFCLGRSASKGHCFIASVHLQPAPRRDGVNGGAGRVSPAANCAAVTGEGNQLNPRAGGQAARQTRLMNGRPQITLENKQ